MNHIAAGIQRLRQTFDGAALAAGIPTFKGQYHGDPSAVDFAVEAGKPFFAGYQAYFCRSLYPWFC